MSYRNYRSLTADEIKELERLYPVTFNKDLSRRFNISIDAIQDHFAYPLGWKKGKEVRRNRHSNQKRELTEEEHRWLTKHYQHTRNADIMERLGIGESTLHRFARKLGLKKSRQFMKRTQKENSELGCEVCQLYGVYDQNAEYARQQWAERKARGETLGFKKGENNLQRLGKRRNNKRKAKLAAAWRKAYDSERRRVIFGMEQKTNFRIPLVKLSHTASGQKHAMIKFCNYFSDPDHPTWVCYDSQTNRSPRREATAQKHGLRIVASEE